MKIQNGPFLFVSVEQAATCPAHSNDHPCRPCFDSAALFVFHRLPIREASNKAGWTIPPLVLSSFNRDQVLCISARVAAFSFPILKDGLPAIPIKAFGFTSPALSLAIFGK